MTIALDLKKKNSLEEEVAMVIRSQDPSMVADKIANANHVGYYTLVPDDDQLITDTYLNTQRRDLKSSSLRIRSVNGTDFVTIKGKNFGKANGPAIRTELEVEWPWENPSPWELADLFDLTIVQQRQTNRRVRNLYTSSKHPKLKAELAIDEVCYSFGDEAVTFFEVEIEKRDSSFDVDNAAKELTKKFPELQRWNSSKLSTGKLLNIALGINTDEEGVVTDESFDNLELLLNLI